MNASRFYRESNDSQAQAIDWHRPFNTVLSAARPESVQWFSGGGLNLCHNAMDRHVPQRGDLEHAESRARSKTSRKLSMQPHLEGASR